MNEIKTTKGEVKKILETHQLAKESDMYLYYEYCLSHWVRETEMYKVFKDAEFRKSKKIAQFESVSRARRELQNDFVSLRSDEKIQQAREAREEVFRNFYGRGESNGR